MLEQTLHRIYAIYFVVNFLVALYQLRRLQGLVRERQWTLIGFRVVLLASSCFLLSTLGQPLFAPHPDDINPPMMATELVAIGLAELCVNTLLLSMVDSAKRGLQEWDRALSSYVTCRTVVFFGLLRVAVTYGMIQLFSDFPLDIAVWNGTLVSTIVYVGSVPVSALTLASRTLGRPIFISNTAMVTGFGVVGWAFVALLIPHDQGRLVSIGYSIRFFFLPAIVLLTIHILTPLMLVDSSPHVPSSEMELTSSSSSAPLHVIAHDLTPMDIRASTEQKPGR